MTTTPEPMDKLDAAAMAAVSGPADDPFSVERIVRPRVIGPDGPARAGCGESRKSGSSGGRTQQWVRPTQPRRHSRRGSCSPHDPAATARFQRCLWRGERRSALTERRRPAHRQMRVCRDCWLAPLSRNHGQSSDDRLARADALAALPLGHDLDRARGRWRRLSQRDAVTAWA
jgi:hypothetical protein